MKLELQETEKEYYLLFRQREVYEKAIETGYSNAVFWDRDDVTDEDIEEIKKWDKMILFSFFDSSLADKYISLIEKLTNLEIVVKAFSLDRFLPLFEEDDGISDFSHFTLSEAINHFPKCNILERVLIDYGWIRDRDYTGRCGNCHEYIGDDKYCQKCGTEKGQGQFLPFQNPLYCLYGPPVKMKFKCSSCGKEWIRNLLDGKYCPECGKETAVKIEEKVADWYANLGNLNDISDLLNLLDSEE